MSFKHAELPVGPPSEKFPVADESREKLMEVRLAHELCPGDMTETNYTVLSSREVKGGLLLEIVFLSPEGVVKEKAMHFTPYKVFKREGDHMSR